MNRMPVSRLSWRPLALGAVPRPSRRSYGLGQAQGGPPPSLTIEVIEVTGNPVEGATVEVLGSNDKYLQPQTTDKTGQVKFDVNPGNYSVRASYKGIVVIKKVNQEDMQNGMTVFLQFPVCIQGSLFRPIDLVIFGVAGGLIAAGSYWKIKPLEMTGEIAIGAAIFGFIYRLQCM